MPTRRRFRLRRKDGILGLSIYTNLEALIAHRNLQDQSQKISVSMQRMSTGSRINSSKDDVTGLGVSERMRAQIRGVHQARMNAQDGLSMVETAEGALSDAHEILQRVRQLAVQYNSSTMQTSERVAIESEIAQLSESLYRIGSGTEFNGIPLLDADATLTFLVGANGSDIVTMPTRNLFNGAGAVLDAAMFDWAAAGTADIARIDQAISGVIDARSRNGAVQNRLDQTLRQLAAHEENIQAAESRVRDVDMAAETVNLTSMQMLNNATMAMLAQANQSRDALLRLLQG